LSAVDWLSESLQSPQVVAPEAPANVIEIEPIETTRLTDVQKDTVGILPAQISGISSDFWGNSSTERLAALIRNAPLNQLPEITALWRRIVLAEIDPPSSKSNQKNALLLARLDKLLTAGDLDPAEALLKAADPDDPQLFRRWFDVSILTQRADEACDRMVNTPNFAPTLQARAFCLARAGDWNAAAVTLSTGKALGSITPEDAELLGLFLDPEAFEGNPNPPVPTTLTPLTFVMREALALPRPTQSLPLAFLHLDLQNKAGWKLRIESAERLVREGALPSITLLDLYLEGSPSASGGVWERVDAVQKLNEAFEADDDETLSSALIASYQTLTSIGLEFVLADWFASALEGRKLNVEAKSIAFKLAIYNPDTQDMAVPMASIRQRDQFILGILSDKFNVPAKGDLQLAIQNALTGQSQKTVLHQAVDEGRLGEAIISALTLLRDGAASDVGDIETALSVMAYEGFREEAKRMAMQLLLTGDNA
jgi:hypothetical protein